MRYVRRLSDAYATHQCSLMACSPARIAPCFPLIPLLIVGVAILGFFLGGREKCADNKPSTRFSPTFPSNSRFPP